MNEFQNISCYCLTQIQSHIYYVKILFQNISCYCLTKDLEKLDYQSLDFKTSHVIV